MDMSGGRYICLRYIPGTFRAVLQTVSLTLLNPVLFADIFQASSLSYTGLTKTVVAASIRSHPQESNNHEKRSCSFLNSYPELTAGSFLEEEALSRAITTVTDTCDPCPSTLFCLGNAVDLESDRSGGRNMPIAVVACGENGYSLAFHRIDDELVNLEREKSSGIRVPTIGSVDPGMWIGSGAPIQQIRFSQPVEEAASWMAARFSTSTIIFRPLYHKGRVPASFAKNASQNRRIPVQNSPLDPNPIAEISSSKTGGHPHADVTFNPWYQKQIGIIDTRGNWSLWNISNKQRRKDGFADRTISGSLPWVDKGNRSVKDECRYDGWASIEWIGDVNKLIACNRRCIILYLIENVPIRSLPIELELRQKSEWILDIKRSPANLSHVFILTTSRVFWLDVSHDLSLLDAGNTTLCPQLSWYHFRDPDDTTLRLTSLSTSDGMVAMPVSF
jgi:RNA polymerase I-specific transcription initiation factor RRN6